MSYAETLVRRTCPRCKGHGAQTAEDAEFCPICGAETVVALPPADDRSTYATHASVVRPAYRPAPAQRTDEARALHNVRASSAFDSIVMSFAAGVGVTALLTAGLMYFQHSKDTQPDAALLSNNGAGRVVALSSRAALDASDAAQPLPQSALPSAPAVDQSAAGAVLPEETPSTAIPAGTMGAILTNPAQAVSPPAGDVAPTRKLDPRPTQKAQTAPDRNALAGTRQALAQGDLKEARARFEQLPANAKARPEARQLAGDLLRREQERDAALQDARWCEIGKNWGCMAQSAAHAKAVDPGNVQSQVMLSIATSKMRLADNARVPAVNGPEQSLGQPRVGAQ